MSELYDVIIAGAGPIGLFTACELGLAGASVLVLERDPTAESIWKSMPLGMRGVNTLSVESFYRRGMLDKLFDPEKRPSTFEKKPKFQFGGHFAGIPFDANRFDFDRWRYCIPGPALTPSPTCIADIEKTLSERANSLGVTILRGNGVTGVKGQDENEVIVEAGQDRTFRGRWLVACDGGRSVIRKALDFDFVGSEARFTGYVLQCEFDHPEKLEPGFHPTKNGMYIIGPSKVLYLLDFDGGAFDRTQEITQGHVEQMFARITGITGVKVTQVRHASAFTDRSKQTSTYRKGRVLLAGDAAHIHPPLGGQGLNLGLGDAMNLGWKLAATIRQGAASNGEPLDLKLLDTYESERHPIGAFILEWTRAQVEALQPGLHGAAIQTLVRSVIDTDDGTNLFIGRFWGLSQRYALGDDEACAHPLVGCSVPDFELADGSRLGSKLSTGIGLLIDFEDNASLKSLVSGENYRERLSFIGVSAKDTRGIRALLVRPDGIVAWVCNEDNEPDTAAAEAALKRWFEF